MDEHRAASAGHAGPGIVIYLDDQVVEVIVPAQPVAWFIGRALERPVVAPILWILAPSVVGADPPGGQQGARPDPTIGAPPEPERAESAAGGAAIALALIGLDTEATQCHAYD